MIACDKLAAPAPGDWSFYSEINFDHSPHTSYFLHHRCCISRIIFSKQSIWWWFWPDLHQDCLLCIACQSEAEIKISHHESHISIKMFVSSQGYEYNLDICSVFLGFMFVLKSMKKAQRRLLNSCYSMLQHKDKHNSNRMIILAWRSESYPTYICLINVLSWQL